MLKEILRAAKGDVPVYPVPGNKVGIVYVGTLKNGTEVDRTHGYPFHFVMGKDPVLKGWEVAIPTIAVGEKCRIQVRSDYAYGTAGSGDDIPADATLFFELELMSINADAQDAAAMALEEEKQRLIDTCP